MAGSASKLQTEHVLVNINSQISKWPLSTKILKNNLFTFVLSGEVAVNLNIQLVIDAHFNNDLLKPSSSKFLAMEEKIKTAVRADFVSLKAGFLF